jgi:hypothetical protein
MKTAIFLGFLFVATAGFGQAGVLGGRAQQLVLEEHPERAEQHEMRRQENLLEHSQFSYEKGERPLWEFGAGPAPRPLGDVAREFRKQHALLKKADIIWEN